MGAPPSSFGIKAPINNAAGYTVTFCYYCHIGGTNEIKIDNIVVTQKKDCTSETLTPKTGIEWVYVHRNTSKTILTLSEIEAMFKSSTSSTDCNPTIFEVRLGSLLPLTNNHG